MKYLERIWRGAKIAVLSWAVWLAFYGAALAQMAQPPKGAPGAPNETINSSVWVFAYFIVILGIALGLLAVCLSSRRRDRARPEQYGEAKVVIEDEKKK